MAISLLIVYARSGGTLFNQCLAALPNTVVISEVNAIRRDSTKNKEDDTTSIWGQAKHWYNISLKEASFIGAILELENHCNKNNLSLIIRDWTFASFHPCKENDYSPSKTMDTFMELSKVTTVRPFVLVRNAVDVWISRGRPNLDTFSASYKAYIDVLLKHQFKYFKYENLCAKPDEIMAQVCTFLNLPFTSEYRRRYLQSKVIGDVQIGNKSRGKRLGRIAPLPRKFILPSEIIRSRRSEVLTDCNQVFDYDQGYFSKQNGLLDYLKSAYHLLKHKMMS